MVADLRVPSDVLAEEDDAQLSWKVIERAYHAVDIYDGPDVLDADLARLTPGQRALLALHWTVGEVSNGGFDQYFTNPTGVLASEALAGLRRIGASETAALFEQLLKTFPDGEPPRDNGARFEAVEAMRQEADDILFEAFSDRFFDLIDSEIYPRAAAYARAHPEEFVRRA